MANTPISNDDEEKIVKENIQRRFKNMFSGEHQPLSNMSIHEVEALKERVAELEAKLAQQPSVSEESRLGPLTEMTVKAETFRANHTKLEESALSADRQKQIIWGTAGILTVVSLVFLGFCIYNLFVTQEGQADIADWVLIPFASLMVLVSLIGLRFIHRGQLALGGWMLYGIDIVFAPIVTAFFVANIYVLVTGYLAIFSLIFVNFVIPKTSRRKAIVVAVVATLAILGIELWNPTFRVPVNDVGTLIPLVGALVVLAICAVVIRQTITGSIRTKLISTFVVMAVFSMAVVAFMADQSLRNNLTADVVESQVSLATSQGFQIGQAIIGQFDKLKALTTDKTIQIGAETAGQETHPEDTVEIEQLNLTWRAIVAAQNTADPLAVKLLYNPLSTQLRNFQETFPENVEILLTDQKGFSIAATDLPTNYYQADSLWWRTAHTTGRYIGQPIFNPATNSIALDIAVPVYSYRNKEFVGVLRATVDFAVLTDLLVEGFRGQTGYSLIYQPTDQEIKLQPLGNGNYRIVQGFAETELQEFSESSNSSMELSLDEVPVLVSSAPVKSYSSTLLTEGASALEDLDWRVIVVQEKAEALQSVNVQTRNNLILALVVSIVVTIIAYFLARLITNPIIRLNAVAMQIASGDLNAAAKVETNDEIGKLAITFNNMTSQLRSLFGSLEQRVLERTHDLELASEVGRTATERVTDLSQMLTEAVEIIRARFKLYYTQIYLTDLSGERITLQAGTGDVGKELLQRKHYLIVNSSSLNGRAVFEKRAQVVVDTNENPTFLPNPLLPNTRSEMSIPLIAGGKVVGVLDMQSEQPGALSETNLPAFQALAGQLAIAIQNAALFTEAQQARAEVEGQIRRFTEQGWQDFLDAVHQEHKIGFAFDESKVIRLRSEALSKISDIDSLQLPILVAGAKIGEILVPIRSEQELSQGDLELIQATGAQLAQHVENLRLLAQAERYRAEAEQAVRRLRHEGWESYLTSDNKLNSGYFYDLNQVRPLSENGRHDSDQFFRQLLIVGDEPIGQLELDLPSSSEETSEIISAVAGQLSGHLENLRLLEQTQQRGFELQEAQSFLDSVVEHLPTMLFVKDAKDLSFVRWNKAAENLSGFRREDLMGKNDYDFFPKEEADFFTSIDRQVLTSGELLDIPEEQLATVHQGTRYLHTRKVPIWGTDGKPKYLLGIAEDITERKKTDEIIIRRAQELETVAKVSTTASTVLDPDQLLQSVVDLTKERFGLYHAHVYLMDQSWNTLLLAAGAGEVGRQMAVEGWNIPTDHEQSIVASAARGRQPVIANDIVRDENSSFLSNRLLPNTRSEMAVPMIVGDKVLGVFDVQADTANYFSAEDANIFITLASQVAVALQNARLYVAQAATVSQLRELDKLKSSFLANMSHELRTPLNSILGFTDVILEGMDGPLTENMDNDLRLVQKNGQHLLHLINDVLDMAKIEAGRMNLHPEVFKVHEVFEEVTSITSALANEKKNSILIEDCSDRTVEIYADRTRLRQVMINLVNNANKFTENSEITLKVAPMEGARVLISVKDMGIGIPPENLESIFQEFTQVDSSTTRKAGGTGLGLPISRRLVEMHGGRLWAESTGITGEGATFFVELPVEARITEVVEKQAK